MPKLPAGTVTLVFTDIEGSTRLLQQLGDRYLRLLAEHRRLLRAAFIRHGGHEVSTEGDAFFVAFTRARDAVAAAAHAQQALANHPWPEGVRLGVRVGIHTGEPTRSAGDYAGLDVHRAVRICSAGHGGQVLLSGVTRELVANELPSGMSVRDLGEHWLKDLQQPERLFQLVIPGLVVDYPPLKSLKHRPSLADRLPGVWNVPFRRNPDFTGRDDLLALLAEELASGGRVAVTQVLHGGGGVGKTTLAVEYAYRHRGRFETVWWVRAEQPATLLGDLTDLAVTLGLADPAQADQQLAVAAVRRWLDDHDRWLLVLDNAGAPDVATGLDAPLARLVDLLPRMPPGQVLVTSRDASWEQHASLAELEVFTPEEAMAFLLARSGTADAQAAGQIAALLGWLPLALEQAGAYVREMRLPLAGYLDRLRRFPALTIGKGHPRDRNPADTVATTWQVSLDRVRPVPGAVGLLEMCAFLAPEEIDRELFSQHLDALPEDLTVLAADPFAFDEAVGALRRFALVKATEQTVIVHRLVRQVIRDRLDPDQHRHRVAVALRLLRAAFPTEHRHPDTWPTYARLLPHVLVATNHAEALGIEPELAAGLLNEAGRYLWQRADHSQARSLFERALAIREAHLGADHPDAAHSLNNLANVLHYQGDLDRARRLFERTLAIREAHLGADHRDTAQSLGNLANVLHAQGDLNRARTLQERALAIYEAHLGRDHPNTARSLSNLAEVLHGQGDLTRARTLHARALTIREARLGADHPDTAESLNNLALVLRDEGDLDRARTLQERALAICEAHLGADHPDTADSLGNLATVLADQGNLEGARPLLERALAICEARLGANHPLTAQSLSNLANVLHGQRDLAGARTLHERALTIREAHLGPDHPDTVRSREALATVRARLENQE
jgi:class 3 adenylate cyclase/tetratricopeptide (TPR) repeat protein